MTFILGALYVVIGYFSADFFMACLWGRAELPPSRISCFLAWPEIRFSLLPIAPIWPSLVLLGTLFGGSICSALYEHGWYLFFAGFVGGIVVRFIVGFANTKMHDDYMRMRDGD